ncbi:hypothetical protein Rpal_3389 [Rhodopseudomonas palustris TIE-1]|uniref:hypothetical protein n=1 Tax=Rhodopseudomonas palustris TaxID=1076 RepID=UPI000177977C|nr:hypothetical protein [Rhodopseudomonas palustris]ACF01891.1 hypothetical protein Rpal_3389 [Rhodopseudomonas palustris TIE-1]
MNDLPELAISVRQPWAWAIIHAGKDVENRSHGMVRHLSPVVGPRAIHAAKGMTRDEYELAASFMRSIGVACPPPADLLRGGIIGAVEVTKRISKRDPCESASRWFFGPAGLVLTNPKPCEFVPSVGALGYFKWKPADASIVPPPARWMLPEAKPAEPPPNLFGAA